MNGDQALLSELARHDFHLERRTSERGIAELDVQRACSVGMRWGEEAQVRAILAVHNLAVRDHGRGLATGRCSQGAVEAVTARIFTVAERIERCDYKSCLRPDHGSAQARTLGARGGRGSAAGLHSHAKRRAVDWCA